MATCFIYGHIKPYAQVVAVIKFGMAVAKITANLFKAYLSIESVKAVQTPEENRQSHIIVLVSPSFECSTLFS